MTTKPDPGRDRLMAAAARGLMTEALAEELDAWAGELAARQLRGELSPAEVEEEIFKRLERDIARRGQS
jgi:hypothetical protein